MKGSGNQNYQQLNKHIAMLQTHIYLNKVGSGSAGSLPPFMIPVDNEEIVLHVDWGRGLPTWLARYNASLAGQTLTELSALPYLSTG